MIYPNNFEHKIGFHEIRSLLKEHCQSNLGKELVDKVEMMTNISIIRQKHQETAELGTILNDITAENPEMTFFDMRPQIQRMRMEGTHIEEEDLPLLKKSLDTLHAWLKIIRKTTEDEAPEDRKELYPALSILARGVFTFLAVAATIDKTIDKWGKIHDNASPELARIRHELRASEGSVNRTLHSILNSVKQEGLVEQDVTPTLREGRLVIPVAPALKKRLRGIVHDESATGKTVYIEPQEVVDANNHIRELEADERREIIQILKHITMLVRPNCKELLRAFEFLAELEFVAARVEFARQIGGVQPQVAAHPQIDWTLAEHPLLKLTLAKQDRKVVPLDIRLDRKQRILIISGPNAGGKSVCLKTVGLIQYMIQCGIPVPLGINSKTGVFDKIMIDIGDEQSIENDLSTYSSHLLNMKNMMKQADNTTLLLIDEFGGGTEPTIGGAIAESILRRYHQKNAFAVITTHYQNLKHFAEDHEGVVNGAMLYDRQQMQALFQLQTGNPGSSFAVEIARKIGIPEDVIADATEIVGKDYVNADKYLLDIVRDKRYWEGKRQTIHSQEKQMEATIERYEREMQELKSKRGDILRNAREQAEEIIQNSNAVVENTIREIREAQAEKERTREIRHDLEEFKDQLSEAAHNEQQPATADLSGLLSALAQKVSTSENDKTAFHVGQTIRIGGQSAVGKIEKLDSRRATVVFGHIRTIVDLKRLTPANAQKKEEKPVNQTATYMSRETQNQIRQTKLHFSQEIDVRGMRGNEALDTIMHYIDNAILTGAPQVRILHGTGTGALRQLIRQYLHTVPQVGKAHDEHVQFGGAGITVVEFDYD